MSQLNLTRSITSLQRRIFLHLMNKSKEDLFHKTLNLSTQLNNNHFLIIIRINKRHFKSSTHLSLASKLQVKKILWKWILFFKNQRYFYLKL